MDLNEYQREARKTAVYPRAMLKVVPTDGGPEYFLQIGLGTVYCALKLAGEGGEYAEKIGKLIRGDPKIINDPEAARRARMKELGDSLWYIANSADEEGYTLNEIAEANLQILRDRQERGVLKGSGDDR